MSNINIHIRRELSSELIRLSDFYSVLVVTGPRQSGKTTLCKVNFPSYHYVNMEDIALREQIMLNPKAFLKQFPKGLIIDEVQNVPELLSYIQVVVDEDNSRKFVLTGSNNFSLMQGITQSLAGRVSVFTLLPLSLQELGDIPYRTDTNTLIINGGYPAVWAKKIPVQDVSRNYYNTYIERDVRQLMKVKNLSNFQTFMKLCAGRVGTELNINALSNEIGISSPTLKEWFSILEASYIVFRLPPFFKNIGKRLVKSPKIYFYDTGLACFLLGIETPQQLAVHPLRGVLFENMVVLEFFKNKFNKGVLPNYYFYRDKNQKEVDLIEEKANEIKAYEIKSAQLFNKNFIKNLDYIKNLLGEEVISTQVIYDGELTVHSSENGMVNFRNIHF
ncbi:ATP-binding protein [Capnocytophaga canis]|uniref:ATP-binding protein n=1 Tax=Capnocytophaga canis TaxID=1848903 RepID=UPI0005896F8C|nr:ATP-binding protein [Capnocytophaga canis]GIM60374.1 ATPase [Capnocytophaga canis]CEN42524.1 ATPase (AAA+ superfamily)-like protein [Capnocytophaga canis]